MILVSGSSARLLGRLRFPCPALFFSAVTNKYARSSRMLSFCCPQSPRSRVFILLISSDAYSSDTDVAPSSPLLVVPPPSSLARLAHVGIVDICVYPYLTDRLQAGDIWRIVVGLLLVSLRPLHSFYHLRHVAYSVLP